MRAVLRKRYIVPGTAERCVFNRPGGQGVQRAAKFSENVAVTNVNAISPSAHAGAEHQTVTE